MGKKKADYGTDEEHEATRQMVEGEDESQFDPDAEDFDEVEEGVEPVDVTEPSPYSDDDEPNAQDPEAPVEDDEDHEEPAPVKSSRSRRGGRR